MICNSKQNALNSLIKRGAIKSDNTIINEERFERLNNGLTEYARKKYGIEVKENLFKNQEGKIVGNNFYFELLDEIIERNNITKAGENVGFDEHYEPVVTSNFEGDFIPNYIAVVNFKKNLIKLLTERKGEIRNLKKKYSDDKEASKTLVREEKAIDERINGNVDKNIKGLRQEIFELENRPPITKLLTFAEADLRRLDAIMDSGNNISMKEAREIAAFYGLLGTFDRKLQHPMFSNDELYDSNGTLIIPKNVEDALRKLKADISDRYLNEIETREQKMIEDFVNQDNRVSMTFANHTFTYEELTEGKQGLKDISWADMFIMDIGAGIFSGDNILPQVAQSVLIGNYESKLVYAKSVQARIEEMTDRVEKALRGKNQGIKIPGLFNGVSYKMFMAKDKNGNYRDSVIQRYSPEYITERSRAISKFYDSLNKAFSITESTPRNKAINAAYEERNRWYRKNTLVLDIKLIPEVVNDPRFSSLSEFFNTSEDEQNKYVEKIKSILGEQGYKEEVDKQIELINNYLVALDVARDEFMNDEGVATVDALSDTARSNLDTWEKANNPFIFSDDFVKNKVRKKNGKTINASMTYNLSIPRKTKVKDIINDDGIRLLVNTDEDSGYYDERFKEIENDPDLKEFHNLLTEVVKTILDSLPEEDRKKFSSFSLPSLRKSLVEILADGENIGFLQRVAKVIRELYDRIRQHFGINPAEEWSYAKINPITGKPDYKVNSSFLRSNKVEIDKRLKIELQRIKMALGLSPTDNIFRFSTYNVNGNDEVIKLLTENLGIPNSIEALQKRLPNENLQALEIGRVLKDAITHQVVAEQSFDLPKLLKMYTFMTMEYAARRESLPIISIIKDHYSRIKKVKTNSLGSTIKRADTGESLIEGTRDRAVRRFESWFNRAVLGNYGSENEFGDTSPKNLPTLGLNDDDKKELTSDKIRTAFDGRIRNTEEKIMKRKLPGIKAALQTQIDGGSLEDRAKAMGILQNINNIEKNLGRQFTLVSFIEGILNFIRWRGLGWNMSGAITNYLEGQVSNMVTAATGDYFTPENIYRATKISRGSFLKSLDFGTNWLVSDDAKKLRILMDRYRTLQDASNEFQKASSRSAFSNFSKIGPYEVIKRTEYLNQSPIMVAILLDTKVKSKDGKSETNLWDAMDADGNLLDEYATEENKANWEKADGERYNDFKKLLIGALVDTHGDYFDLGGNLATEYLLGKFLQMFKRWMSREFYKRFAPEQVNLKAGIRDYKGRYRSHTAVTGALHGAIVGFGGLSIIGTAGVGLAIGAAVGGYLGVFHGSKRSSGMGYLKELAFTGKELFLNLIRMPTNRILGKQAIKDSDYEKAYNGSLRDRDLRNLRANLVDMSITMGWIALMLFTKALLTKKGDDDDREEKLHNLLINRFMQLSSQAGMYSNPVDTWDNLKDFAPLKFFNEVHKLATAAEEALEGRDILMSGPNAGESRLLNQIDKTFLPAFSIIGRFDAQSQRQFEQSPFDKWFEDPNKTAQDKIKRMKAQTKATYLKTHPDLSSDDEDELDSRLRKYFNKKKGEKDYQKTWDRIKKQKPFE